MRRILHGLLPTVILGCLLGFGTAEGAWYLAGYSNPQQNAFYGINESATPPATYSTYEVNFYGFFQIICNADRGSLTAYVNRSWQPSRQRAYSSFRFDDVVFSCLDGRSEVTYRPRLELAAEITWTHEGGDRATFSVGDPTCAWGGCANTWGGWSSWDGGSGVLSGVPSGAAFDTLLTGPARTAVTDTPRSFSVSVATEAFQPEGGGTTSIAGSASLPLAGPVFELPAGCTCNSAEGNIIDNRIVPHGIIGAEPAYGGDDGIATIIVIGTGFEEGATIRLRGNGPDVPGDGPVVYNDGTRIRARFDLRGAARGLWDIEVQNPLGAPAIREDAFEVQPAIAPSFTISTLVGRGNRVLVNTLSPLTVSVTNHGNVDAVMTLLSVRGLPSGSQWLPDFEMLRPDPLPSESPPLAVEVDGTLSATVIIPRIAPGQTRTVAFRASVPDVGAYRLEARTSGPLLPSTGEAVGIAPSGMRSGCGDGFDCLTGGFSLISACLSASLPFVGECGNAIVAHILNELSLLCAVAGNDVGTDDLLLALNDYLVAWIQDGLALSAACAGVVLPPLNQLLGALSCIQNFLKINEIAEACCNFFLGVECGPVSVADFFVVGAFDPNEKAGSSTTSSRGYVPAGTPITYQIFFENLATATAPAQTVEISDELPAALDPSSLTWGPIRFGSRVVVPDPFGPVRETVDLRPEMDVLVAIESDVVDHSLYWRFTSLDPETGQPTTDPLGGFLPPNLSPPEGEGSVSLTVHQSGGLPTDTEIENTAVIVFDNNPAIETNLVRHRIDVDRPLSAVASLPPVSPDSTIALDVLGSDFGSGVQDYLVYVSEDSGPFSVFGRIAPEAAIAYPGRDGHSYGFYSVARDSAGNLEEIPTTPDATTRIDTGVPVLFSRFEAQAVENGIEVRWRAASSAAIGTATLERSSAEDGPWESATAEVQHQPDLTVALDRDVEPGETLWYRLRVDLESGGREYSRQLEITMPEGRTVFALRTLSPNPTAGEVRVEFELPVKSAVDLRVFDVRGREVATLAEGTHGRGRWRAVWEGSQNGRPLAAGVYYLRLEANGRRLVRRIVLLRR